MKHSLKITLILIGLFFVSQAVGISVLDRYIDYDKTTPEMRSEGNVSWKALPTIAGIQMERLETPPLQTIGLMGLAILVGTGLLLVLIKFQKANWWKIWYSVAILFCLTLTFKAFMNQNVAFVVALVLTLLKVIRLDFVKPSFYVIIHNLGEVFVYAGLAVIFVPVLNLLGVFILLGLISIYDVYAVWKSKHMIKLAKFLTKTKAFAGMAIPYKLPKGGKGKKMVAVETAILGGGDIGFPMIFAGVVMKSFGYWSALIIAVFVTISLAALLLLAKKDKFYPAMPFLSVGCLIGFLVVLLI